MTDLSPEQSTTPVQHGLEPGFELRARQAIGEESLLSFSARTGITRSYLYDIFNGAKAPSLAILTAIADNTGFSLEWLVTGRGVPTVEIRERTLIVPHLAVGPNANLVRTGDVTVIEAARAKGARTDSIAIVAAPDDSLAPRIGSGDLLIVESRILDLAEGAVYFLHIKGRATLGRAVPLKDGSWVMMQNHSLTQAILESGSSPSDFGVLARVIGGYWIEF